ncbi:MAG TPA: phosphotriesterase-related protein [Symbiobacteriaceae bacterium]|jgi:phosphotriesterase-related protein
MSWIETVLGPIPADQWGTTLCHEHLCVDLSGPKADADAALTDEALVTAEAADLVAAGGRGLIEVTCIGMGRNPAALRRVAAATGIHVVCATGFYYGRFLPDYVQSASVESLADRFELELRDGIPESGGVRAGVIAEIGTSRDQVLDAEAKVFRAAALAQRRTGAAITTHASLGTMALQQLDMLERAGADLTRVAIGHQDLNGDLAVHAEIVRRGAYVQYDTVGKTRYRSDEERVRLVLEMADRGLAHRLMLSCDISRPSYLRRSGGYGYAYLLTDFLPALRSAGLDEATLDAMLVENPRRLLAH